MSNLSASIPALKQYLTAAEALGVDIRPVLAQHNIDERQLEDNSARISLARFETIFIALLEASGHPYFGLYASNHINPSMYASLGLISISAASLRACIEIVPTYETLVGDMGYTELQEEPDWMAQVWHCQLENPLARRHISEAVLASWFLYGKNMLGLEGDLCGLSFQHDAPATELSEYQAVFSCEPRFSQTHNALHLPKDAMDRPLPQANPALQESLIAHADQLLERLSPQKRQRDLNDIHRTMRQLLPQGSLSKSGLAASLNMSSRTLQRRFEQAGSSYQESLSQIRFELAKQLLRDKVDSHSICQHLGFTEPRSFFRRFKQWSGMTTREFLLSEEEKSDL
ncbi:AraC family transcriptional regulator [Pseudoteredinibacter isoporae]|uniref:AraC-like DNA-binding protein n=1 Tax=Pseudoteredinibacter isoporae TaxID=570281 RepID=A0A7X0JSM7_9GAMM|nr:AraC family transcriptional regulator [Pseudoteredinibacter isoporae]MBB6521517.1 AraC-like DNA-binding protein [Pseudoteredinibacter isoporae]NHO87071.1 helix-turn-helix domain-containing protein [Pseudoteredinibacter isoporae]NIB22818.1 helix-turn-helix domain-containing protein [Pseudoteredinibacter isoporae]